MNKTRLEAFSDGVIAILITIMVLELKIPHGDSIRVLAPVVPVFLTYVLSYVYLGIYWNNHHHMLHATTRINGKILWANLHLLFWLSLFPFVTGWMGANHFTPVPTALYGIVMLLAAIGLILVREYETLELIRLRGWFGMLLLLAASLGIGWLCGGPEPATRRSLAVTTGARNAAVGLVIVSKNFADTPAVTAVIAFALVSILGTLGCAFLFAAVPGGDDTNLKRQTGTA